MSGIERFDVAVIGGGSGLTAAHFALEDGKSVALVEAQPEALGGTCVNWGCLPTKGLVASADVMRTIRGAGKFGIELDQSSVRADIGRIMRSIREARAERARGVRKWVEESMSPFFGRGRFADEKVIEMEDGRRLTAEKIFLATGARAAVASIEGLDEVEFLTNESALELEEMARSLVIVGGGYVGCEFGHFFEAMGCEVTIVHPDPERLLDEDDEIGEVFTKAFGERVRLELGARVTKVERSGAGVCATYRRGGEEGMVEAERVMIATGRRPNTDGLGLERTGVRVDEKGWIEVDDRLRTDHEDIYAYGDCIGRAMFKHTSSYEGKLAYGNAQGGDRVVSYEANPHAVFGEPEVASVGLTERACRERGLEYEAASVSYDGIAKGEILGSPAGLAKAIVERGTGRILGFHIAGPEAAILVQEVVFAMSRGLTADAVRDAIHIHPSMPELVQKVFTKVGGG